MKVTRIFFVLLLSSFMTNGFAQRDLDSTNQSKTGELISIERTSSTPKEVSFGYHHGNYKHPVKANLSKKWFRVRGNVNRNVVITNYKRQFSTTEKVEQLTTVTQQPKLKENRNYKRPYSNN